MTNIGTLGELDFNRLCTAANLNVTIPQRDINGWDAYIEFPISLDKNKVWDSVEMPIKCKVQVKATNKFPKRQITLSVMQNLATEVIPAFICFIQYNKNNIKDIYLIHIDEYLISKTLKKIRESQVNNKALNKSTLLITCSDKHKLKELTGEELKRAIENNINTSMAEYTDKKDKILKEAGFDKEAIDMTINIKKSELLNKKNLLDPNIKINQLEVDILEMNEKRFDISLPILKNINKASLSFKNTDNEDFLFSVQTNKFEKPCSMKIKLRKNPFLSDLLFFNDFITFYISSPIHELENNLKIKIDLFKKLQIKDIFDFFYIYKLLISSKNKTLYITINSTTQKDINIKFTTLNMNIKEQDIKLIEKIIKINKIYNELNLNKNHEITISNLLNIQNVDLFFYFLFNKNDFVLNFKTNIDMIDKLSKYLDSNEPTLFYYSYIILNSNIFFSCYKSNIINYEININKINLTLNKQETCSVMEFLFNELSWDIFFNEYRELIDQYQLSSYLFLDKNELKLNNNIND